jgi:hypothetical protein
VQEPALFWLDGHYSGGETARGAQGSPIIAELETVFSRKLDDVVLIDDIRCFTGFDGYPSLADLKALVAARRPDYSSRSRATSGGRYPLRRRRNLLLAP